jgi:hypothetical protein
MDGRGRHVPFIKRQRQSGRTERCLGRVDHSYVCDPFHGERQRKREKLDRRETVTHVGSCASTR